MISVTPSSWTFVHPRDMRFLEEIVGTSVCVCVEWLAGCVCCCDPLLGSIFSLFGPGWSSMSYGMQSQVHCAFLVSAAIRSHGCCLAEVLQTYIKGSGVGYSN